MSQTWTDDVFATGHVGQTDLQNMENNFACIKSSFSGGSAPSDPTPGMFWTDTGNHILKLRNEANDDWLSVWDLANDRVPAGSIVEACVAALAITEGKIAAGAVTEGKLGTGAVTEGKLGAGAVSAAKLASAIKPWILLSEQDASNDAAIDFISVITSTYDEYVFLLLNVVPVVNHSELLLRYSTDNGSTFKEGATDYKQASTYYTSITLAENLIDTAEIGGVSGEIHLLKPSSTTQYVKTYGIIMQSNDAGAVSALVVSGMGTVAQDVDAIRFLMSSGNITSGNFKLYGIRK